MKRTLKNVFSQSIIIILLLLVVCNVEAQPKKIGEEIWSTKNLNVSKFRNGDTIMHARTEDEWRIAGNEGIPAWCYYENKIENGQKFGKLYNRHAILDPRNLAPVGWEIPTAAIWNAMFDHYGGWFSVAPVLKSQQGWNYYIGEQKCQNCLNWSAEYRSKVPCHVCKDKRSLGIRKIYGNGKNTSGFNGLPGGVRTSSGTFEGITDIAGWWAGPDESGSNWSVRMFWDENRALIHYFDPGYGFYVRLIKSK